MQRYGFQLRIQDGSEAEYRKRHENVDQELLEVFERAGIRTYSIFMRGTLLFGYMEADDIEAAMKRVDESAANTKWQAFMRDILQGIDDMEEVFYFSPSGG